MAKIKLPDVDGLGPKDEKALRHAIRKVWSWNYARRLCIERATDKRGFGHCEKCKQKVAKLYADHKKGVGSFHPKLFIVRMFVSSAELQALCAKCHGKKTREEAKARKLEEVFF